MKTTLLSLLAVICSVVFFEGESSELGELWNDINTIDNAGRDTGGVYSLPDETADAPRLQTRSKVPIHSNGVVTVTSSANPVKVAAQFCSPRTVLESLPDFSQTSFYWPSKVEVKRCMGECRFGLHPSVRECAVTKQEKKNITVLEIPGGNYKDVTIIDHLNCACDCRIRAEHCDPIKEKHVKDECACKCVGDGSLCDSSYQKWDSSKCQCVCKYPAQTCSSSYEEWNSDICKCDCRKDIKKRCIRKSKLLDRSSCRCVCPPVTCPPGHVVDRATCACIAGPTMG